MSLQRIWSDVSVQAGNASLPLFQPGLEFNSPAHGPWNIVHTGMLLPESIQIYVCAKNCMRGVVLTAAEMNAANRFSFVIIDEADLLTDNLEEITIEGVTDVLHKRAQLPKAVLLFTVCLHHFAGSDLDRIYTELSSRFPEVYFIRCFMDPIMQKQGPTPDQKLRKAMYDPILKQAGMTKSVTLAGSDFTLGPACELHDILHRHDYTLKEFAACQSWNDYQALGGSELILSIYPPAKYGVEALAKRLDKKHLYLPANFSFEEITEHYNQLLCALGLPVLSEDEVQVNVQQCHAALADALQHIGQIPIVIDYTCHPRPLGLARLLIEHGFNVCQIFLDAVSAEEIKDFEWLKAHATNVWLTATIAPKMRVYPRHTLQDFKKSVTTSGLINDSSDTVLAIGQKAAWFTGTKHFVNIVSGGGLYGFDGIRRMAELITDAFEQEKEPQDYIIQKGWGCDCCL